MKLSRLGRLLSVTRYRSLKKDFRNPLRALLASSGVSKKPQTLTARAGHRLTVHRGDLPLWEEYFTSRTCKVSVNDDLFHVVPNDGRFAPYDIKGGCQCLTFRPERWNKAAHRVALVRELEQSERAVYSQHGEDGVIVALLSRIPVSHKFIVEFGAYDGVTMSNSRRLIEQEGWAALLIEPDACLYKRLAARYRDYDRVTTLRSFVKPANINRLFRDAAVPEDFEVLSIDIDGPDYYVWQALTDFRPKIVIVEYNACIAPEREYVVPQAEALVLSGTSREGASLLSLYRLGKEKGYNLIYGELAGANLFFIHDSCKQHFDLSGLRPSMLYQPPQFGVLADGPAPNGRGYL